MIWKDDYPLETYPSHKPYFLTVDHMDPSWCLKEARKIVESFPVTMQGSASGKFYSNYKTIHFLSDSKLPLIKNFVERIEQSKALFKQRLNKEMRLDLIQLVYIDDASQNMSIPHKDRYWMDGQFHLTILGNADIDIWQGEAEDREQDPCRLVFPNGTIWYINSTEYYHTINTSNDSRQNPKGERFELLAPVNTFGIEKIHVCANSTEDRYIDPNNKIWQEMKKEQINNQRLAFKKGTASSPSGVGYIHNVDALNIKDETVKDPDEK